ncbi:hypothetical protein HY469_00460 [Candidatus Roizmanbacteria bacterium]|nr:hypothetical protein [Candidatus Roizmanbacteria bacterium]
MSRWRENLVLSSIVDGVLVATGIVTGYVARPSVEAYLERRAANASTPAPSGTPDSYPSPFASDVKGVVKLSTPDGEVLVFSSSTPEVYETLPPLQTTSPTPSPIVTRTPFPSHTPEPTDIPMHTLDGLVGTAVATNVSEPSTQDEATPTPSFTPSATLSLDVMIATAIANQEKVPTPESDDISLCEEKSDDWICEFATLERFEEEGVIFECRLLPQP